MKRFVVVTVQKVDAATSEEAESKAAEAVIGSDPPGGIDASLPPAFVYANDPDSIAHPTQIPGTFLNPEFADLPAGGE